MPDSFALTKKSHVSLVGSHQPASRGLGDGGEALVRQATPSTVVLNSFRAEARVAGIPGSPFSCAQRRPTAVTRESGPQFKNSRSHALDQGLVLFDFVLGDWFRSAYDQKFPQLVGCGMTATVLLLARRDFSKAISSATADANLGSCAYTDCTFSICKIASDK